jgi:hypothetical protein
MKDPLEKHGNNLWLNSLRNDIEFKKGIHYQEQDKLKNKDLKTLKNSAFDKDWQKKEIKFEE